MRFQVIGEYGEFYGAAATRAEAERIRAASADPHTRIFDDSKGATMKRYSVIGLEDHYGETDDMGEANFVCLIAKQLDPTARIVDASDIPPDTVDARRAS